MQRAGSGNIRQRMIKMEGPSRLKRRRPQRSLVDTYIKGGHSDGWCDRRGCNGEGNPRIEEKKHNLPVRM